MPVFYRELRVRLSEAASRAPEVPSGARLFMELFDAEESDTNHAPCRSPNHSGCHGLRHRLIGALVIVFFATASSWSTPSPLTPTAPIKTPPPHAPPPLPLV